MKNRFAIPGIISFLIFFSSQARAQQGTIHFDLNYNYSIPVSGFKSDLISDNSPRGMRGSILYEFNNKISAGIESGYQDYYQKYPRAVYSLSKTQDISAVLSNSIQTTPFLLKAKYFPVAANSVVKPYISLGAGLNLIDFKQYFGEFGSSATNVGFLAQGGIGLMVPFGKMKSWGLNIGANYDYAPYKKYGYTNLNSINLNGGVVFRIQ